MNDKRTINNDYILHYILWESENGLIETPLLVQLKFWALTQPRNDQG